MFYSTHTHTHTIPDNELVGDISEVAEATLCSTKSDCLQKEKKKRFIFHLTCMEGKLYTLARIASQPVLSVRLSDGSISLKVTALSKGNNTQYCEKCTLVEY